MDDLKIDANKVLDQFAEQTGAQVAKLEKEKAQLVVYLNQVLEIAKQLKQENDSLKAEKSGENK